MTRRPWILIVLILLVLFGILIITAGGILYALFGDSEESFMGKNIAVIDVQDVILESRPFIQRLQKLTDEGHIKGIVIRVDSPGGVVGPCQEMYDAVLKAREKKPIVISMGAVAASGGYYIAAAGQKIVANP